MTSPIRATTQPVNPNTAEVESVIKQKGWPGRRTKHLHAPYFVDDKGVNVVAKGADGYPA